MTDRADTQRRAAAAIANAMSGDDATKRDTVDWLMHLISTDGVCGCFFTRCAECSPDDTCDDWQRANQHSYVGAYDPPELAVSVGEYRVEVTPPVTAQLGRVDLIVEETNRATNQSRIRALAGVPSAQPVPPLPIQNHTVWQTPVGTVDLPVGKWRVEQEDIHPLDPVRSAQ